MKNEFEMSLCGKLNYFLGLQVQQRSNGLYISQTKYANDLVKKFGLDAATAVRNPMGTSSKLDEAYCTLLLADPIFLLVLVFVLDIKLILRNHI
ncbi:putative reverse transcriptase, RNA-dependent DNA polymerase [Rosa chinensis]|uniref:Putative reverse transcriptase, RNA-dependent DNA polymerase n=1 Tax=Rosa chinensis TaxID=74649 RepID=A0A2P6SL69_ROSCH|nr:putative reverse transcriptase, RNA-dependent DNA polymerase [Rosa chinensis]